MGACGLLPIRASRTRAAYASFLPGEQVPFRSLCTLAFLSKDMHRLVTVGFLCDVLNIAAETGAFFFPVVRSRKRKRCGLVVGSAKPTRVGVAAGALL
jgi:hypothetical protein